MYYCSYCHVALGITWQHWGCLGTTKLCDNPPHVWYYRDALGNYWLAMCDTCYTMRRLADLPLSDDE